MKHIDISEGMPGSYTLVYGSDIHFAVKGFSWKTADKTIKRIKGRKHCYWTAHGDNIDYMRAQDSRFRFNLRADKDAKQEDWRAKPLYDRASDQLLGLLNYFDSIGDSCVEVGIGNHEDRIINELNVAEMIAKQWGCEWGTPKTIVDTGHFKSFLWHPFKFSVNSKAGDPQQNYTNECVRIRRAMRRKEGSPMCRVNVMSHIHKKRISRPQCSTLNVGTVGGKLEAFYPVPAPIIDPKTKMEYYHEDHRWFASTGAMFGQSIEGDYTYQETRDYDPVELGWIEAVVKNDKLIEVREMKL